MSRADFEIKGLDEMNERLLLAVKDFPSTAEKGLVTLGNKLKKECAKNTPVGRSGKLQKGWKHVVEGYNGSELIYKLKNKHPIHHLLNNGHVIKTRSGKTAGYYEGQHYTEKSIKNFESNDLKSGLINLTKKLLKKAGGS